MIHDDRTATAWRKAKMKLKISVMVANVLLVACLALTVFFSLCLNVAFDFIVVVVAVSGVVLPLLRYFSDGSRKKSSGAPPHPTPC